MLKTESAPIHLRWTPQGAACRSQSSHQVETPEPVTLSYEESNKAFDSDDAGSQRSPKSDESDSDVEQCYRCPCGKKFSRVTAYTRHVDVAHSNAECYKCTECGKTFGNERTLTMHMSVHQDSKHFTSTIERCSKSRTTQKSHKINGGSISHVASTLGAAVAQKEKMRIANAHSVHSIKSTIVSHSTSSPSSSTGGQTDSSQNCSTESHDVLSSGEESAGTDKENYSPKHVTVPDNAEPELSPTDKVPPLINSKYQTKPGFELDLSFPKSKAKAGNSEAVIVSGDTKTITPDELVSRFGGVKSNTESNKVSIITIKADRSLLSDSLVFHSKGKAPGDIVVTPGSHSVIVIKTQDISKNKLSSTNVRLEPVNLADIPRGNQITTCLKNDANSVRKSQRLQGKVPGWKQMLNQSEDSEQRAKRRKMAKVKVEEVSNGYEMQEESQPEYALPKNAEGMIVEDIGFCDNPKRARSMNPNREPCGTIKTCVFKCIMCDRSFESEKYLSMHMSLHKVDNSMESLMQQNNKEDELEDITAKPVKVATANANGAYWTCKICNKVFAQNSNYKNHIRTHSDERPFVCQVCSIGFKERYHLKKHMLFKHSNELKEECRYCGKKFKDSTAVRAHERIHSDVRPYSCRRCGKSFKTSECLWHHENRSKTCGQALIGVPAPSPRFKRGRQPKKEAMRPMNVPAGVTVIPMCTTNSQQFMPGTSLLISDSTHVVNSQMAAVPQYSYSEVAAATASIQSQHVQQLVPLSAMSQPQLVKVHCNPTAATTTVDYTRQSGVTYVKSSLPPLITVAAPSVQSQSLTSARNSPVMVKVEPECALPDYELTAMTSSDGSYEENHADILMEEDPSMPSVAMIESVESESGIGDISHETIMQLQEEIKKDPVLGDIEMSFLQKTDDFNMDEEEDLDEDDLDDIDEQQQQQLNNHIKTADNHYTCDKCGKKFVSVSAFDKHLLTHSGIRPYVCTVCNVGFKLKVHLKKHHLYRHSDEKPCECSICGKKFKDSSAVRLHERIHSTERPFHCECSKTFKTRENLWGHRHRGPCEKRPKLDDMTGLDSVGVQQSVMAPVVDMTYVDTGPVYTHSLANAHAQPVDASMSAPVVTRNNHIMVSAGVANTQLPTTSANDMRTDSIGTKSQTLLIDNVTRASMIQSAAKLHEQPQVSFVVNSRSEMNPVLFSRSQESRVSLPVLSATAPMAGVPTAVVAPLKREVAAVSVNNIAVCSASILKPIKREQSSPEIQKPSPLPAEPEQPPAPADAPDTSLPPFETFSPTLRGKAPTLADRCPTIQRYLQMAHQPVKLPGIQQLFQSHSLAHALRPTGLIPQVAMAHSLLQMRCSDPSAPLGPHPIHSVNSPQPPPSPQHTPSPQPQSPRITAVSQHLAASPDKASTTATPTCSPRHPGSILVHSNAEAALHAGVYFPQSKLIPMKADTRATSPYPGSLPLLLPMDPNMGSTSGDLTAQSPADPPATSIAQMLPIVTWDDDKKTSQGHVWQTEHEQLFQDLTQTTAFGQL